MKLNERKRTEQTKKTTNDNKVRTCLITLGAWCSRTCIGRLTRIQNERKGRDEFDQHSLLRHSMLSSKVVCRDAGKKNGTQKEQGYHCMNHHLFQIGQCKLARRVRQNGAKVKVDEA